MKVWLARDESGALFIHRHKPEQRRFDNRGVVWESTDYWQLYHRDYPEVTFKNSPVGAEFKLIIQRKASEKYIPEYGEFEGVVLEDPTATAISKRYYRVKSAHGKDLGRVRFFGLKQGCFNKDTAPKKGDTVLLQYRRTKKRAGTKNEVFDIANAKIIKVL